MQVDNKRIARNTIALYIRMIVIMAINFYMVRVVLDVLGATDYGIYNAVGTIVVIFSFLKSSLSEATQRFLNYEMGRSDSYKRLREIFSTCVNCYLVFVIIVFLSGELFWLLYGRSLSIPEERFDAATVVFHMSLLTFVVSIFQVPYNSAIIAYEKMDFFAKISIGEALLKLLLILWIKTILYDKLELYSYIILANSLIILLVYYGYCIKRFPICRYIFVWEKRLFRKILSFTGWNMLGSLSGILSESGVNLLFNLFCGVLLNASLGLANQVNNAMKGFSSGYMTAFNPQIVKTYAAKEYVEFKKLFYRSSKFSYFLFFMISIPLIFKMDYLLSVWLVEVPDYTAVFAKIILIGSLIDATTSVFYSSMGATGKIKYYQISISIVFLLHFVITYILLYFEFDYVLVFFSRLLTRGLLNFIVGILFVSHHTVFVFSEYVKSTLLPIIKTSVIPLVLISLLCQIGPHASFLYFIIIVIIFELSTLSSIFFVGLTPNEKMSVVEKSQSLFYQLHNKK